MKRAYWFFLSLVLLVTSADPALAQTTPAASGTAAGQSAVFGIQTNPHTPDNYFSVTLNPGESASLVARVVTVDSVPLALTAYVTNALSLINGGFGAGTDADVLTAPAAWIDFTTESFTLAETDHIDLPFTVTVPADALPGEYVAALIAQTDGPVAVNGAAALNQIIRNAIPVLVTVPGETTPAFVLQAPSVIVQNTQQTLVVPVQNTGNARVRPTGEISVSRGDGTIVGKLLVTMGTVFPGTETTIELAMPSGIAPGTYAISGTLADPASGVAVVVPATSVTVLDLPTPTPLPDPVTIDLASITAIGTPIQYANVSLTVNNIGANISTGRVTLTVTRDGQEVEAYVLAQNQAIPYGTSTIETRYIPASGWQSGTYTFEVRIESVDANGDAMVVVDMPLPETIAVP